MLLWLFLYKITNTMNRKTLCISLLAFIFISCNNNKLKEIENLDTINLKHSEIIDLESKEILNPIDVFKIDGYFVFRNHLTKNKVFTFMSDDYAKVYSGVSKGNGPNEVTEIIDLKRYKNDVFVMDVGHQTLNKLILKDDSVTIEKQINCKLVFGSSFALLDGCRFVAPTTPAFEKPGMLALVDSTSKVQSLLEYPEECHIQGIDMFALAAFYCNTRVAVSPDGKHYAYGVYGETSFGFGDIIDNSFENNKTIVYKQVEFDKSSTNYIITTRDNLMSTATIVPTDKYAIFLYIGKPYKGWNSTNSNTLLLFSWSGRLCKKVILDMELMTIDFDDKTKILYGIALNPEACLVKYDLSELFL